MSPTERLRPAPAPSFPSLATQPAWAPGSGRPPGVWLPAAEFLRRRPAPAPPRGDCRDCGSARARRPPGAAPDSLRPPQGLRSRPGARGAHTGPGRWGEVASPLPGLPPPRGRPASSVSSPGPSGLERGLRRVRGPGRQRLGSSQAHLTPAQFLRVACGYCQVRSP